MIQPRKIPCECPVCRAVIEFDIYPPSIQNLFSVSIISFEHNFEMSCKCGAILTPIVNGQLDVRWTAFPVPQEKRRTLVSAPPPSKIILT